MPLVQLIYISSAREALSEADLDAILESSVRRNALCGVTGFLLYSEGNFLQVLEGEAAAIDETFGRILKDARHEAVLLLSSEPVRAREFATWHMSFRRLGKKDADRHAGYAYLFEEGFDAKALAGAAGGPLDVLKLFYREC